MAIKLLSSQTTAQTETDNQTVFLLEEGSSIALATGGNAMTLNTALGSTLHVQGTISQSGGPGMGVFATTTSNDADVRVGETGRVEGTNIAVELLGPSQHLINNGVVRSLATGSHGVFASGANDAVINHGRIKGGTGAGSAGVGLGGTDVMLDNDGRINAAMGVYLLNTTNAQVHNRGHIFGSDYGVLLDTGPGGNEIHNEGLIAGGTTGISSQASSLTIFNSGMIRSDAPGVHPAIEGGAGVETILNAGEIVGDVFLGAGNDSYTATGSGHVHGLVYGDLGDDTLRGSGVVDALYGGGGIDQLYGRGGNDLLNGGEVDDVLLGGRGDDNLIGDQGNDVLTGQGGNDVLSGGDGNDVLQGAGGKDTLRGDAGDDQLFGQGGKDRMFGDAGIDTMLGGNGADAMHGGADLDIMLGGAGNDRLFGDDGSDIMDGGAGNDLLRGGAGDDILEGNAGNDRLFGGGGADQFIFSPAVIDFGHDRIMDFTDGVDLINLSGFAIPDMAAYLVTALSEVNGNAVLDLGAINPALYAGDVTLVGVSAADITPLDFV